MEFDKLIDIVFKIDDTINFLWNLYIGVGVVLLGWLFRAQIKWQLKKRITVSLAFIIVAFMNASALLDNYSLKKITLDELRQKPEFSQSPFLQAFAKNTGVGEIGVISIHLVCGLRNTNNALVLYPKKRKTMNSIEYVSSRR